MKTSDHRYHEATNSNDGDVDHEPPVSEQEETEHQDGDVEHNLPGTD